MTAPERGVALTDGPLFLLRAGAVHRDAIDTITSVHIRFVHLLVRTLFRDRQLTPIERLAVFSQRTARFCEQVLRQHVNHVQVVQAVA